MSQKPRIRLEEMRAKRICNVRYGRAGLTIERWGRISTGPVADALEVWRRGDKSAEHVAWAYVKARLVDHTPSFRWQDADLTRLIALVTGCSKSPEIKARTPEELATELQREQAAEVAQLAKAGEAFAKYVRRMTVDWAKIAPTWPTLQLAQQSLDQTRHLSAAFDVNKPMHEAIRGLDINRQLGKSILALDATKNVSR